MDVGRLAEISKVFLEEGLALGQAHPAAAQEETERSHLPKGDRDAAARLRRAFERLGPTFVKFGQLLATRLDLFSPEFIAELSQLRAHVPPFSTYEARQILERDLGTPVEEIFSEFPDTPIASASIAQVYRARLREDASSVAVKITRPNLAAALDRDLEILIDLSRTLDRILPVYHRSMVHRVALEYAERTRKESDLLAEAHAIRRFADITEVVPTFVVPKVHMDHCCHTVLVMQWLEGTLLDDVQDARGLATRGIDPERLVIALLRLQLVMSYEFGFVHGDTHPGNLILLDQDRIGLIDFGLHGQLERRLCDQMLELLLYQTSGRTDEAIAAFSRLFSDSRNRAQERFKDELRGILERDRSHYENQPLTGQLIDGIRLGTRHQLHARSELFLVLRNLTIIEGIVLTYCPDLDLVAASKDILQGIMMRRALGGRLENPLSQLEPDLLLALSRRTELIKTLLRLERSLTDAENLGDFLKREGVEFTPAPRKAQPLWVLVFAAMVGALLALAAAAWLN